MPTIRQPRSGSMAFWPRKRAKRRYAKVHVHAWAKGSPKMLGFAGYKVGMTQVTFTDNRKTSPTKGEIVTWPATILECPPLHIHAVRLYKSSPYVGRKVSTQVSAKTTKELERKLPKQKSGNEAKLASIKAEEYADVTLVIATNPKATSIGKKKPEVFEVGIGGTVKEKIAYATSVLGKEIKLSEVFKEGDLVDIHGITKGKGFQGSIKRFGISIRQHKSEKTIRGPGTLGGWKGQGHFMYRVPHAGQMGNAQRTEYNKYVLKIGNKPEEINAKGGFVNYGLVKNEYILLKGGVTGVKNNVVRFNAALRPNKKKQHEVPALVASTHSPQGR